MTAFEKSFELASGNFGLITARQMREIGISTREVSRWLKMGRLEKSSRGVYRVSMFPASQFDNFAAAVESVGPEAYLFGESVLGLLNLTATNPTWMHVATDKRVRKELSSGIRLHVGPRGYRPAYYDGVRSQRVADAILACRETVRSDRLKEALRKAVRLGYVRDPEARKVQREIA